MNSINSIKTTQALPVGVKSQRKGSQASSASLGFSKYSGKSILQSQTRRRPSPPLIVAVANTEPRGFKISSVRTPLEPISPEGKFLSFVLHNHRHLFSFAVSQQLDELASDKDEAAAHKMQSLSSMESVLHKRIAEIKEKERQTAVEDVIYMSIVHKFSENGLPMVQELLESTTDNRLESSSSSKCRELESIHSLEVQEMIREHVARVLRMRGKSFLPEGSTTTKIDRLDLGRIYAASVMYGYFLKSAAFRRHMDTSLVGAQEELRQVHGYNNTSSAADSYAHGFQSLATLGQSTNTQLLELCHELQMSDTEPENLKSYVMGFDAQSLQRSAKLKSKEAVNVIEKHTWALFGNDSTGEPEIFITFPSLERLVLEAAAFGTFLWDVESSVDSTYKLKKN